MIKTVEIAPYMFVNHLVDVVENEVWASIMPTAWDDSGLDIIINKEKLREALLKALLAGEDVSTV